MTLVSEDFTRLADPFRRELLAHCYRMLGSVHDAEDLVQETYLRAWRAFDSFEGRSSLRTWLYRIATNVCLTALDSRSRRPLPAGLGMSSGPDDPLAEDHEVPWLEPIPTDPAAIVTDPAAIVTDPAAIVTDPAAIVTDPAAIVTARQSTRLAFVAALQLLPPKQRAVLILRDVLGWSAAETAAQLEITVAAANSALQRARAQVGDIAEDEVTEPSTVEEQKLLDRWVKAFEAKDIPRIVEMFTNDVVWEMPPYPAWYRGPDMVAWHLANQCPAVPGGARMVPVRANDQPAFGLYLRDADGVFQQFNLQVITLTTRGISHVASFFDPRLFGKFGLPNQVCPPGR